jgi:hypothetical protein
MRITTLALALSLALVGCSSKLGGGGDDDDDVSPPMPDEWAIDVDVSGLDRFVPAGTATWTVAGRAESRPHELAGVSVADAPATVGGDGSFSVDVAVSPGLTPVAIEGSDVEGHVRQADRTLLSARFLPEGEANREAAGLVLTDEILASMGGGLAGDTSSIDVAAEILSRDVLSQDDRCVTWPVSASQEDVTIALVRDDADLWVHIQIPDLYVYFEGECQGVFSTIPVAGEMWGTIDLWTRITAVPPTGSATCLSSFSHTTPEVEVQGWYFDVWGTGGPLQSWIIELFSGSKSEEARAQLASEMQVQSDDLLSERLADVVVFDSASQVSMLGQPVDLHLCLSAMTAVGDDLVAQVAATASGAGGLAAPGAPQIDGPAPAAVAGELLLDSNLVSQLLFSAWRAGGLARPNVQQVELDLIGLLVPELREHYPDAEFVDVSIDGELPPIVRATSEAGGDLRVEIGDLMLRLTIGADEVFRFGVHLILDLDLVPTDGMLVPTVIETDAVVTLLGERFDAPDDALEDAVALKIGDAASALLGGAAIALPSLPGLGAPADVTADAGGRYLHIHLQ